MNDLEKSREFESEDYSTAPESKTQFQIVLNNFLKHKVAVFSVFILIIMYFISVFFPSFFAPYDIQNRTDKEYQPPQRLRFIDQDGDFSLRPFVYNYTKEFNSDSWENEYSIDTSQKYHLQFFVEGPEHKLLGIFETDMHLFGVEDGGEIFLFGTDQLGRDLFSRVIHAGRVSLTIGFVGVFISLIIGLLLGGISAMAGGVVDDIIQRIIELMMSIPRIPLWMSLAAAVPSNWSPIQVYFAITIILSLMGWTGIARVVRSKFISLREEDFVSAAISYNTPRLTIITKHLIPNFISYVIVNVTLAIPGMILGETSLSFLGIGLQAPVVSLGVLLERAQNFQTVTMYPWLLLPGLVVIIVVLAFNFVGDGLRDAADPYSFK
ncbi:MAG: ABC transporter permease [bacterium]